MGASYYVAIHHDDWPSVAMINQCLAGLNYPVRIPFAAGNFPLGETDGTLAVAFKDKPIELEAAITQLSATTSFAYSLKVEHGETVKGLDDFVPLDLNTELRKLGVADPSFRYGDYVLSLTFRTSIDEWQAGFFLMSGLIRCSNGMGFEFEEGSYGGVAFADKLAHEASEME